MNASLRTWPLATRIVALPAHAWTDGLEPDGTATDQAQVAELTGLNQRVDNWINGLRLTVRRTRPAARHVKRTPGPGSGIPALLATPRPAQTAHLTHPTRPTSRKTNRDRRPGARTATRAVPAIAQKGRHGQAETDERGSKTL